MRTHHSQLGFTLMETLVAVMIMTGGLIVIGSSWSSNLMRIEKARINANLAALLERKMTEFDLLYRGKPVSQIKEEDSGEFNGEYLGYRWEMRSKEFEMPNFTSALGGASADASQADLIKLIASTVSEYMKNSVKEVTVTVFFKSKRAKAKEMQQSVATYFVDYSKPISVPGLDSSAAPSSSSPSANSPVRRGQGGLGQ
jgi:general secretion pathway protein I